MNPHLCRVVLRPRGPLEVFDLAVRLLRVNAGVYLRLVAVVVLPLVVAAGVACVLLDGHLGLLLVPLALAPLLQAPATLLTGRLLFADEVRVRDVLWEVARRAGGVAFVAVCTWGSALLGCGVLSWLTGTPVAWVTEATLLEQVGASRGLQRSFGLSLAHLGVSLSAVLGWWGLTAWGAVVGEAAGQAVVGTVLQLGSPFGTATELVVTPYLLAGALLAQPIYAVYRLLLYVDARTRVEGWDLQVALRASALAAAEGP